MSVLLVAAQFLLIALLVTTTEALGTPLSGGLAFALVIAATFIGIAALAANRPGNFNIRPDVKADAQLVTDGIYAHLRHPMYSAVLLAMLAAVAADPRLWRIGSWLALLAVLIVKLRHEERLLAARFADYPAYCRRTRRLVPGLY